nr:heavy metal-associated isoprenylated plant protein 9-like [Ipomoea batatas]
MGEEVKQQQEAVEGEAKVVEEKKEEKAEEKKEEKGAAEEEKKEEEEPPKSPPPFVLYVDLHCMGCAKKIERSILKIRGVEGVVIDMAKNQVTIKGVVEPQAICTRITKKTKRVAKVLSPLPAAEGEPIPEVVASQVSGLTTVELTVNMHCEACAQQLKSKILKMKGVRTAETELASGKVTVTGTMDADKLVDYVYRRTKKQAKIVPQPEPEPEKAPPAEEPKPEEKKAGEEKPAEEAAPEEKKEEGEKAAAEEENKEETKAEEEESVSEEAAAGMHRMMYYYQPLYFVERIPPAPQIFSDENPNACCIS